MCEHQALAGRQPRRDEQSKWPVEAGHEADLATELKVRLAVLAGEGNVLKRLVLAADVEIGVLVNVEGKDRVDVGTKSDLGGTHLTCVVRGGAVGEGDGLVELEVAGNNPDRRSAAELKAEVPVDIPEEPPLKPAAGTMIGLVL